jgi:DNA-binding response OmpR family regulator
MRGVYRFGPFRVDADRRIVFRCGHPIPLRPTEFDVLIVLLEARGTVVETAEILRAV